MKKLLLTLALLTSTPLMAASIPVTSGVTLGGGGTTQPAPIPRITCPNGSIVPITQLCPFVPAPSIVTAQLIQSAPTDQNKAFYASGTVVGASIKNVKVLNPYRIFEMSTTGSLSGVTFENIEGVDVARGCINVRHDYKNIIIRNLKCMYRKTGQFTTMRDLPNGIQLGDTTAPELNRNTLIENVEIDGAILNMTDPTLYWNGDALSVEDSAGLTLRHARLTNSTDGGIDTKARYPVVDDVYAAGNKRNFRFWNGLTASTITCGPTHKRGGIGSENCLWLGGHGYRYFIQKLVVRQDKPIVIIQLDGAAESLEIVDCDIQAPAGSVFLNGKSGARILKLGPNCHI